MYENEYFISLWYRLQSTHTKLRVHTFVGGRGDEDEHAKLIMWILKPMKRSEIDGEIKPEPKWMLSITIALDK